MNRLFMVCALFALCAVGCTRTSDSTSQNSNRPVATPSPSATATATGQSNQRPDAPPQKPPENTKSDVTGAYFPDGVLPGEFSEIEHLNLATIDDQGKPAPLNGFIRPKRRSAKDYKLENPTLNGKDLTFSTSTVNGVSYSFNGAFVRLDDFSANTPPSEEVILKGTLTKMKDGKSVAETKVGFSYFAGD